MVIGWGLVRFGLDRGILLGKDKFVEEVDKWGFRRVLDVLVSFFKGYLLRVRVV